MIRKLTARDARLSSFRYYDLLVHVFVVILWPPLTHADAIRNNLDKILTLPDEAIICPGHGPMTSVGEEKAHNPFFVGKV